MTDDSPMVTAYIVLKGSCGSAKRAKGPITSANVAEFVADPEVRRKAKQSLARLGFRVGRVSAFAIGVEAPAEQFKKVFHAHVCLGEIEKGAKEPVAGPHEAHWSGDPTIPEVLGDLVEEVVFPRQVVHDEVASDGGALALDI